MGLPSVIGRVGLGSQALGLREGGREPSPPTPPQSQLGGEAARFRLEVREHAGISRDEPVRAQPVEGLWGSRGFSVPRGLGPRAFLGLGAAGSAFRACLSLCPRHARFPL